MEFIETLESYRFLDVKLINILDFVTLVFRYGFNLLIVYLIIQKIYYPIHRNDNYVFTFFILNTLVFFVCYLMSSVKLDIGFAFGLFALFSIMRYRTDTVPVKEMTYLFAIVAVAVVNSISTKKISYLELTFTNFAIAGFIYWVEKVWYSQQIGSQTLVYEKIENIKPENYDVLISDLEARTGLQINSCEISRINFLNDTARVRIHYNTPSAKSGFINKREAVKIIDENV